MKMNLIDFDTSVVFEENNINVLEVNNKKVFYRIVNSLFQLSIGNYDNTVIDFFENEKEINLTKKIVVISDYFNIDFSSKNILNRLYENIDINLTEEDKQNLQFSINDVFRLYRKYLSNIDIDLEFNEEVDFLELCRLFKLKIKNEDNDILNKILLIIDIESELHINKLIIFNNLKLYLSEEELQIVYDYILGKKLMVLFIENLHSKVRLENEKKYVIDNEFEEFIVENV